MARSVSITKNESQIVSTSEAKTHLRVSTSADDDYIQNLIFAATEQIEKYINCVILEAACVQWCDTWTDTLELYYSPLINSRSLTVTHIKYYDDNDTLQTWDAANYVVDNVHTPARIGIKANLDYPTVSERIAPIIITYTSGYSSVSQVPADIKQAILIMVGQWYENRQVAVVGRSVGTIPMTAEYLIEKYKARTFGLPC